MGGDREAALTFLREEMPAFVTEPLPDEGFRLDAGTYQEVLSRICCLTWLCSMASLKADSLEATPIDPKTVLDPWDWLRKPALDRLILTGFAGDVAAMIHEEPWKWIKEPETDDAWVETLVESFSFWRHYALGTVENDEIRLHKRRLKDLALPLNQAQRATLPDGCPVLFCENAETFLPIPFLRDLENPAGIDPQDFDEEPPIRLFALSPEGQSRYRAHVEKQIDRLSFLVLESVDGPPAGKELDVRRHRAWSRIQEPFLVNLGGNSLVFRIQDQKGRSFCVKFPSNRYDRYARQAFDREFHLLRRIARDKRYEDQSEARRRHMVRYRGFGLVQDKDGMVQGPFLLMDYVKGNLRQVIEQRRNAFVRDVAERPKTGCIRVAKEISHAVYVTQRIAAAIEVIRDSGEEFQRFRHLDLKPENLLGKESGVILLCDFNSAPQEENDQPQWRNPHRARSALTREYCAPEVWEDPFTEDVDDKADVFSIGRILAEMLPSGLLGGTGENPVDTTEASAIDEFKKKYSQYLEETNGNKDVLEVLRDGIKRMMQDSLGRPTLNDVQAVMKKCSQSLREFLVYQCGVAVAKAEQDTRQETIQDGLDILAEAFGGSSSTMRLRLPSCHGCRRVDFPDHVKSVAEEIRGHVGCLKDPMELDDAMKLLRMAGASIRDCPGLVDLETEGVCGRDRDGPCWKAHGEFSYVNQEWLDRPVRRVAGPGKRTVDQLAHLVLEWIGGELAGKGGKG